MDYTLRLPDELIGHTLRTFGRRRARRLQLVCKRWRRITTADPMFWKYHYFTASKYEAFLEDSDDEHTNGNDDESIGPKDTRTRDDKMGDALHFFVVSLDRAGGRPVEVYITFCNSESGPHQRNQLVHRLLCGAVGSHLHHIERLDIKVPNSWYMPQIFEALRGPAPLLRRFFLSVSWEEDQKLVLLPHDLFAGNAALLRRVQVNGVSWDATNYPQALQNVDVLWMQNMYLPLTVPEDHKPQLHLTTPHLRELNLMCNALVHESTLASVSFWDNIRTLGLYESCTLPHHPFPQPQELIAAMANLRNIPRMILILQDDELTLRSLRQLSGGLRLQVLDLYEAGWGRWRFTSMETSACRELNIVTHDEVHTANWSNPRGGSLDVFGRETFARIRELALLVTARPRNTEHDDILEIEIDLPALEVIRCYYEAPSNAAFQADSQCIGVPWLGYKFYVLCSSLKAFCVKGEGLPTETEEPVCDFIIRTIGGPPDLTPLLFATDMVVFGDYDRIWNQKAQPG